jgi:NAD(P)-dependent dehydrogenase (short-subunit alcohol dehydrogenase family)
VSAATALRVGRNDEETRALVLSKHPIGRLGEADDVATAIRYLGSDDSSFVTGAELVVDGGYSAV